MANTSVDTAGLLAFFFLEMDKHHPELTKDFMNEMVSGNTLDPSNCDLKVLKEAARKILEEGFIEETEE